MATPDFNGTWYNQLHSEMQLRVSPDGQVLGRYRTGVGSPTPEEWFPLAGFSVEDVIVFTVSFARYGSLTAWAGQVAGDPPDERLQTLWHLARNVPDPEEPKQLWAGILAGADRFTRLPQPPAVATRQIASHPVSVRPGRDG